MNRPTRGRRMRAITLVESVIAMLIVSVMLVAALNTVGAARRGETLVAEQTRGIRLAEGLMAEILQQVYEDPTAASSTLGVEADDVGNGTRGLWDDVDDYHRWSASPPQHRDGTEISDLAGWTRRVAVAWVDPSSPSTVMAGDRGLKRIRVVVTCRGRVTARLVAYRSRTWAGPADLQGSSK